MIPITIESDNEPITVANLMRHRPRLFHSATIPLLFQYYGSLPLADQTNELPREFEQYLSNHFDFVYLSLPPKVKINQLSKNWKVLPQKTPAVLSDSLKSWGNKFRDDVKNKIHKARRENIEIVPGNTFPSALWQLTFQRRGMSPPISPEALKLWCDELIKESLLRIYLAKLRDQTVAFRCELVFGAFAYDWLAGSDPQYHATGANQLLMAETGQELGALNLDAWDLVGGQVNAVDDFKEIFRRPGYWLFPHSPSF